MMAKIKCPKCNVEGSFSTIEPKYEGPYRCWKCRDLFTVSIEDGELKSWEPLTEEELTRLQEIEALKKKMQRD